MIVAPHFTDARVMTTTTAGTPYDLPSPAHRALPRRSREELEALAADFVNSKLHRLEPLHRRPLPKPVVRGLAAAGAAALVALGAWLAWPATEQAAPVQAAPAANEAESWTRRLEAERARKRQELASSRQYLAKMAAADTALLQDMGTRAQALAARADGAANPVRSGDEPTPKTVAAPPRAEAGPAPASQARPAPSPAAAQAAPVQPQQPAPVQRAATPGATQVAAAAPRCDIHVSELSSSGKLTYADVARMKGTRTNSAGHVFTPPLQAAGGRTVVFEVMPSGCVRIARGIR